MTGPAPWWDREKHRDRRPFLLAANSIRAAIRRHFTDAGFVEVEAAVLQVSPSNETHLHAFATVERALGGQTLQQLYLHTSPEFACKKLLAAGEERLFTLAPVFRNRERSALHHPAFTMLEWYRADAPYETLMADCADMLRLAAEVAGSGVLRRGDLVVDPALPPERLSCAEAFERFARIDLLATVSADGATDREAFAAAATASGIRVAPDDDWSAVFSRVLAERIEPRIGRGRATLLDGYPVPEAALARPSPHDPRVAERFELYACGVELANAFGELSDPAEQRRRFLQDMDEKERLYGERYPLDEDFLQALAFMPEASGAALGVERLVMLATGAAHIEQVTWTPVAQAGPA